MKLNSLLLYLLLLLFSSGLQGQEYTLRATILEDNLPAQFVDLLFVSETSVEFNATTDELGTFKIELPKGTYQFQIYTLGTLIHQQEILLENPLDLGSIPLTSTIALKEVLIDPKKKLLERKADRLVFNVENSTSASGGTAIDALRVTPGVQIKEDAIRISGKSTVLVLIDDRPTYLTGDELTRYLENIQANDIKSIEVITTPPARYEAEGNSGIINIVTKKTRKDSWNANFGANYIRGQRNTQRYNTGYNINKGPWTFQSSFNYNNTRYLRNWNSDLTYPNELWQNRGFSDMNGNSGGGRILLEYAVHKKWDLGMRYNYNTNSYAIDGWGTTRILPPNKVTSLASIGNNSDENFRSNTHLWGLYSIHRLDTLGKKLTIDVDYYTSHTSNDRLYESRSFTSSQLALPDSFVGGGNFNKNQKENFSSKIGVDLPLEWITLDFGAKASISKSRNQLAAYSATEEGESFHNPQLSNQFDFTEYNQALYISGNKEWNDHWEMQIGLRGEATQTKGYSLEMNQKTTKEYMKLFPTAYVVYSFNDDHSLGLNYARRIQRPWFESLNPFRMINNAYSYNEGNPFLEPSFTHNVELTYTYKEMDTRLYFSSMKNGISQSSQIDPVTQHNNYIWMNHIDSDAIGISHSMVLSPTKWWTSSNEVDVYYTKSTTKLDPDHPVKGTSADFSSENEFTLNAKKTLSLSFNYFQFFGGVYQNYRFDPYSKVSASVKYQLLDKKLALSLHGTDMFKGREYYHQYFNGVKQEFKNIWDMQSIRFSAVYRFGNQGIKLKDRKAGNQEEINRM